MSGVTVKRRHRSKLAAIVLPKWVTASQVRRLDKVLKQCPNLDINLALLQFSRETSNAC